ncbi:MAG: T9SS type A sorting domain-containing protein [Salinibacter sp.]|uniref:T9SS type A sorting domain-containing protein n=1 Tax=Salinibacter sp. TaxID=2065818 RepID=UPI0035D41E66
MRPLCKGWGVYEDNVIYVLRSMTISPTRGKSSGENLDAEIPPLVRGLKATYESGAVHLEWEATVETDDTAFEVQRKRPDAGQWSRVDTLAGTPPSPDSSSHHFTDTNLPYEADQLSYRLRVIKTNGANSYSQVVTVRRRARDVTLLSTFPNPVRHRATLRYAVPGRQNVTIVLYDALGRQVETVVNGMKEGHQEKQINVSGLPSGRYFLRLRARGEVRVERLTVVR